MSRTNRWSRVAPVLLCVSALAAQQRQSLPRATGTVEVPATWTTLHASDLDLPLRASDPETDPGRAMLRARIADVRQRGGAQDHLILHAAGGSPGSLRVVDAFAEARAVTSLDVSSTEAVAAIRQAIETSLTLPGFAVSFVGHEVLGWFPVGSLVLHFHLDAGAIRWQLDHHVVPAGEQTQLYATLRLADDRDAAAAIEAVIRSFDGAREGNPDFTRALVLGGIAGAAAGMVTALVRRFLRDRTATRASQHPEP